MFLVHFNFKFISQNDFAVTLSFGCRPTVAFLIYGFLVEIAFIAVFCLNFRALMIRVEEHFRE